MQNNEMNLLVERVKTTKRIVRTQLYSVGIGDCMIASDASTEIVDIAPVTNANLATRNNKIISTGRLALLQDVKLTGQETFENPSNWVYDEAATPKVYSL